MEKIIKNVRNVARCPDCGASVDASLIDPNNPWEDPQTWFVCCTCGRQTDEEEFYKTMEDAIDAFLDDRRCFYEA